MKKYFSGIDVGTSSLKAVVIELVKGSCKTVWTKNLAYNRSGNPDNKIKNWHTNAKKIVKELLNYRSPDAIGFTGQMHTLYIEDYTHSPSCPVLLWFDMHGSDQLRKFKLTKKEFVAITGNIPLPDFTLAKWLHNYKNDLTLPERAYRLYCAKDIVRKYLSPNSEFVVDSNEATGTQLYDIFNNVWSQKILKLAKLPKNILPMVIDSRKVVGNLDSSLFNASVKKHIPLVLGSGDQATASRAVGAYKEGIISVSLGTSGVISMPVNKIPKNWNGNFHVFPLGFDAKFHIIGTIPAFGTCINWLKKILNLNNSQFLKLSHKALFTTTEVYFLPYLSGTGAPYPNHSIRGQLLELSIDSSALEIIKAVFLGIALEFQSIIFHAQDIGVPVKKIVFSGGGVHIPALLLLMRNILNMKCEYVKEADASAIGAALLAADSFIPHNNITAQTFPIENVDIPKIPQEYKETWSKYQKKIISQGRF